MGKDFESLLPLQQCDGQFLTANPLTLPLNLGIQNTGIPYAMPCTDAVSTIGAQPMLWLAGLPNIKPEQLKEPPGWLYCLPRFRQGFIPEMMLHDKLMLKTNLPVKVPAPADKKYEAIPPSSGAGQCPKQFLVFDQTGSKMTMMFSSGIGTPISRPSTLSRKPDGFYSINENSLTIGSDEHYYPGPNVTDDFETDDASGTHEDTEDINALLFSDDEDNYSDDWEETSTGNSPSKVTTYEKQDWFDEEDTDEVACSAGPVKRQKLSDSGYRVTSVTYARNSVKLSRSSEYEDDAESSCAGTIPIRCIDSGSISGSTRLRKEKIREAVTILQTILPGEKGKDAVIILDKAINYLRVLKLRAKSIGLSGAK